MEKGVIGDRRPAIRLRVVRGAQLFDEAIEAAGLQDRVQLLVEHVARRPCQLPGRHSHAGLLCLTPAHRHPPLLHLGACAERFAYLTIRSALPTFSTGG